MKIHPWTAERLWPAMLLFAFASCSPISTGRAAELGDVRVTGVIQGWCVSDGKPGAADGFSVRRAEIKLSGQAHPLAAWFLMIDPAKPVNIKTAAQGGP